MERTDYSEQEQQGLVLVAEAEDLKVIDQASLNAAGEMLKSIKLYIAEVQKITSPVKAATHAAWKAAVAQETGLLGKAEEAERILGEGGGAKGGTPEQGPAPRGGRLHPAWSGQRPLRLAYAENDNR